MRKLSKVFAILLILVGLISCTTLVNAYSATASLGSSSTLKAGETITVNINLGSLDVGSGIDAMVATLDFDENVLEPITQDNISGKDGWSINAYSASTKKFTATRSSKYTTGGTVATITFKAKSDTKATTTTVTLKNIEVSGGAASEGGTGDITISNSPTVTIKEGTTTTTPTTNTTTTPTTTTNTVKDSTTSKTQTLPRTGVQQYEVIAIIAVAVVGILSFVLYKKLSKEVK